MAAGGQKVRYVVLHHTGVVPEHFDLMLQVPGEEKLWTWRILTPPASWRENPPTGERLADHRAAYMTYEGAVSGGRGAVKRVAEGEAWIEADGAFWRVRLEELTCELGLPAL